MDETALPSTVQAISDIEHEPTVFIFDNYPGGIGLSRPLYEIRDRVLGETLQLIQACACDDGCPSCVGPYPGAKEPSLAILNALVSLK